MVFPSKPSIDLGMLIHYGQQTMEVWAAVQFGPLSRHIDGEVAAQYGLVKADVWCDLVLAALAAKLDEVIRFEVHVQIEPPPSSHIALPWYHDAAAQLRSAEADMEEVMAAPCLTSEQAMQRETALLYLEARMTASAFSKDDFAIYVPEQETINLTFVRKETRVVDGVEVETDKPLFWADVRADITFSERERMQKAINELSDPIKERLREENLERDESERLTDSQITRKASLEVEIKDLWDVMAPYVLDWSVGEMVDGKPVPVDPPAVAGGQQFGYIHDSFTGRIWVHLWTKSQGDVDVDFLGRLKPMARPSSNGDSSAKSSEI